MAGTGRSPWQVREAVGGGRRFPAALGLHRLGGDLKGPEESGSICRLTTYNAALANFYADRAWPPERRAESILAPFVAATVRNTFAIPILPRLMGDRRPITTPLLA